MTETKISDGYAEHEQRPTLMHRIEHTAFMGAIMASSALGTRGASAFGEAIGKLGYFPLRIRRAVAENNLRQAFPDRDEKWIQHTVRAAYAHLGRESLMALRLRRMTGDQLLAMIKIHDLDVLERAVADGRGAVLVTGHIGNQEIAGATFAALGHPLDVVAQRQHNPLFDAAMIASRERMGMRVIDRTRALRLVPRSLKAGRMVGFVADQNAGKAGIFVPYFGRLASTHRGAALFAVRAQVPLILAVALRRGDGYEGLIHRIDVDRNGPLDDVVYNLTAAFTAKLEEIVRSAPDQYLWQHRRWKSRPSVVE